jgi:1-acyl-sn-glycerol-3-phosphate acyltransferase
MNQMSVATRLAYIGLPKALFEIIRKYFRVEVQGLEHIPTRGRALVIPNHSGCAGLDAVVLAGVINKDLHRIPRILTLWTIFHYLPPAFGGMAERMGLKPAYAKTGINLLKKNCLTVLFPEGVYGSFKPSSQRYHLQEFHPGFVRMAALTGAPIIPCVIIGAEESNINLGMIEFQKFVKGLALPMPLNLVPFPAKCKMRFKGNFLKGKQFSTEIKKTSDYQYG